jgi:hypothetical protein
MDGLGVGFYDSGRQDVHTYANQTDACAAFIYRECLWIKEKRQPGV